MQPKYLLFRSVKMGRIRARFRMQDAVLKVKIMKPDIHPNYTDITVTCSCGESFKTRSTLGQDLSVEVCSQCHPFYTGKQKILDTAGRVDRFNRKYGMK